MKISCIMLWAFLLLTLNVFSQAPQKFNYQAVLRDDTGTPLIEQSVSVRISLLRNGIAGIVVYNETHSLTTTSLGLVTLEIGNGTTSDDFTTIDWGSNTFFLKVELDATGGTTYTEIGTSQLLSVPYAIYSSESGNALSGDYADLINKPDSIKDFILSTGGMNITNLANPVNDQDAVTKAYVDMLKAKITSLEENLLNGGNYVVKDIDRNVYKVVKIGNQIWMAENLTTTKLNDGTAIPYISDSTSWDNLTTPGYCWIENNDNYGDMFGGLYNFYAVETGKLCPTGWHVPTDLEWSELTDFIATDGYPGVEGDALKVDGGGFSGMDIYGFAADASGWRYYNGEFNGISLIAAWWTSYETSFPFIRMLDSEPGVHKLQTPPSWGLSVRCIRD